MMLITFMFCLTLSGCSERVNLPKTNIALSMSLNLDGSISQTMEFSMQTELMEKLAINESLIKEVQNNMIASVRTLRNEFYLAFLVKYSTSPDSRFKIGEAVKVSDVEFDESFDVVFFSILFKDSQTWQYYHGDNSSDNTDPVNKSTIKFFTKTSSEGNNPFSAEFTQANGKVITIGQRYMNIYKAAYNLTLPNEVCAKLDTPSFVYDYATPFSSLRSNAELTLQSNGLYHNLWIKNLDQLQDAKILLTYTTIYAGWWYLSLMLTIIFALLVCLIVYKIKYRRK